MLADIYGWFTVVFGTATHVEILNSGEIPTPAPESLFLNPPKGPGMRVADATFWGVKSVP